VRGATRARTTRDDDDDDDDDDDEDDAVRHDLGVLCAPPRAGLRRTHGEDGDATDDWGTGTHANMGVTRDATDASGDDARRWEVHERVRATREDCAHKGCGRRSVSGGGRARNSWMGAIGAHSKRTSVY